MKAHSKYFLEDLTFICEGCREECTTYEVRRACGNTVQEFLESLWVHEVDADGKEVCTCTFEEAPAYVKKEILRLAGIPLESIYPRGSAA